VKGGKLASIVLCMAVVGARPARGQTVPAPAFVDGAAMADRDPTELFDGAVSGVAGRGAFGMRVADRHTLRFEIDVPTWRVTDVASSSPVYCAETSFCVGRPGFVPARTTQHTAVRTVSYAFLYARHFSAKGRAQVALIAGASVEGRAYRSSGVFDELDAGGRVVRHSAYSDDRTKYWPAVVLGMDVEVALTSHLVVVPQFRIHTFPYPAVSIARPGVALRWRF
jgi:hypothetical protein